MEFVLRSPVQGIPHPMYGSGSRDDNVILIFMGWAIILILLSFEWTSSILQTKKIFRKYKIKSLV
jgi:hypothetical protein